jgi:hypothetical protein
MPYSSPVWFASVGFLICFAIVGYIWPEPPKYEVFCKATIEELAKTKNSLSLQSTRCLTEKAKLVEDCKLDMDKFCASKIEAVSKLCDEINCTLLEVICSEQ